MWSAFLWQSSEAALSVETPVLQDSEAQAALTAIAAEPSVASSLTLVEKQIQKAAERRRDYATQKTPQVAFPFSENNTRFRRRPLRPDHGLIPPLYLVIFVAVSASFASSSSGGGSTGEFRRGGLGRRRRRPEG